MSRSGASIHLKAKPASMRDKQRHARSLAYLGHTDKILAALGNEFGPSATLPSVAFIEMVLLERANQRTVTASILNREPHTRERRNYGESQ